MAWDELERDGQRLRVGEGATEELVLALRRAAEEYRAHLGRLPYVDELLLTLERALGARPEQYVEDPAGVEGARLRIARTDAKSRQRLDFREYEGYFQDAPEPGHYGIKRRGVRVGGDVVTLSRFDVRERVLEIHYALVDPALNDDSAVRLIQRVLLADFMNSYFRREADTLVLRNTATGEQQRMPYTEA